MFLAKYGNLNLCDENVKKILIADYEEHQFNKNNCRTLIVIHDEPNGLMFDHDYFFTHKGLYHIIFKKILFF